MKYKVIAVLLVILSIFTGCQISCPDGENISYEPPDTTQREYDFENEIHGVWISCYDWESADGKTREEYSGLTDKMFKNISDFGFNTAFVHLRAYSDAFYKSDLFPYSKYVAGKRGGDLPFDPFEVMLESAGKYGISVHGWINPFRISYSDDSSLLCENEKAKYFIDKKSRAAAVLSSGIYYNPADTQAQKLILDGIREIVTNYKIDGIHIDDYFYPEDCDGIDTAEYEKYISSGGKSSLADWRRDNINTFVSSMYSAVKSVSPDITVSISPAANLKLNYDELYADCKKWISCKGYTDIIIPQIYFGFKGEKADFYTLFNEWNKLKRDSSVLILCGLGAYKSGTDESDEWKTDSTVLSQQLSVIRNNGWNGFVLFSYSDLLRKEAAPAVERLKESITVKK